MIKFISLFISYFFINTYWYTHNNKKDEKQNSGDKIERRLYELMSQNNSHDVKISYIEDDLAKIQTKTNLYIQKYGDMGVFHLFKEVAQNSIDEYIDPALDAYLKSIGEDKKKKVIKITHDRLTDKVTIEDNGRGIPEEDYPVDIVCTKLQSGAKFFRDQGGSSSGEFGVDTGALAS